MGDTATEFEAAFADLFRAAFRVARRILGDHALAEDVAAESTARAYAHWRRIGDQPWREGWVVRVASNLAIDAARARSRRGEAVDPAAVLAAGNDHGDDDGHADHQFDVVVLRIALVEALAALPRRQREVITLRYLAGYSEAEAAAILKVTTGSVKTHLHRGLGSLRKRLGPDAPEQIEVVSRDV